MNATEENQQVQPQTAIDQYNASREELCKKQIGFFEQAQDGSNLLVEHTISIKILESINAENLNLRFPSSEAIEIANRVELHKNRTNLTEDMVSFVNELSSRNNLVCMEAACSVNPVIAPSKGTEEQTTDSSN